MNCDHTHYKFSFNPRFDGKGLTITYGTVSSPYGDLFTAYANNALIFKGLARSPKQQVLPLTLLWMKFPEAEFIEGARPEVKDVHLYGTPFQHQVWQSVLKIPAGQVHTYKDIANDIGKPNATRAVGAAVGANPVSVLVPCHRVIPARGGIGNYAWGAQMKADLLKSEGVQLGN